ncbi:hypothetical protein HY948_04610 [Candidatus Gottesmanbacteria bacterium]|nr:hypothetical protein [Candidatus Gottesmanbacteria bacterium]
MAEIYRNQHGKERPAYPREVAIPESTKRKEYFQTVLEPNITAGFVEQGIHVAVDLIGSTVVDQAGPDSDIDCLVSPIPAINATTDESWRFLAVARAVWRDVQDTAEFRFDLHCVLGDHSVRV